MTPLTLAAPLAVPQPLATTTILTSFQREAGNKNKEVAL